MSRPVQSLHDVSTPKRWGRVNDFNNYSFCLVISRRAHCEQMWFTVPLRAARLQVNPRLEEGEESETETDKDTRAALSIHCDKLWELQTEMTNGWLSRKLTRVWWSGSRRTALSPPRVYYSRPLVGPLSRSDIDGQLLLRSSVPGSWQEQIH